MSRAALVIVPMLIVIVVAIGLRVGAGEGVRAAIVYGAPRSGDTLSWQIFTLTDYGSARETLALDLHVAVKAGGKTHSIDTATNTDGIAEIAIPTNERPTEMEIRSTDGELLAWGGLHLEDQPWHNDDGPGFLKPTRQEGTIGIHVAPWGGRLTAGFAGTLSVKLDGAPVSEIDLQATGEEGLSIERAPAKICSNGFVTLDVLPLMQVSGLTLKAKTKSGATGDWFGPIPIALGGMMLGSQDISGKTNVTAPGEAKRAYIEIADEGRRYATVLDLAPEPVDPRPHASLVLPASIPTGYYWIVLSPDPRGAEALGSSTIARHVHVGDAPLDACEAAEKLAWSPRGFPRYVALDGLTGRRALLGQRRARGRTIALSGILSGSLLELLLIFRASREAKRGLDDLETAAPKTRRRIGAFEIAIALAIAMLGFAMLAAIVAWLS